MPTVPSTWFHYSFKRPCRATAAFSLLITGFVLFVASPQALPVPVWDKQESRVRIRPSGIDGALLLCGEGKPSETAIKKFMELAGSEKARLVIIPSAADSTENAVLEKRGEEWKARKPESVAILPAWSRKLAGNDEALDTLRKATGVWIEANAKCFGLAQAQVGAYTENPTDHSRAFHGDSFRVRVRLVGATFLPKTLPGGIASLIYPF